MSGTRIKVYAQYVGRTFDELFQLLVRIEVEMCGEAEACAQRAWQHTFARGSADDGESRQGQRDGACARAFADHHIDAEVLHRDIQQLFGGARQTMDLVDEQHFADVEGAQNRSKITGMLNRRAGSHANRHFKLIGNDHGQRGFAQARRAGEQNMVRWHIAFAGRVQEQLQLGLEPWLSDKASENMGAQLLVADRLVADRLGGDHAQRLFVGTGVGGSVIRCLAHQRPLSISAKARRSTRGTSSVASGVGMSFSAQASATACWASC